MLQQGLNWIADYGTSRAEMEAFASRPLLKLSPYLSFKTRSEQGYAPIRNKLPFHIEGHPDANTSVARSMLTRMEEDIAAWSVPFVLLKGAIEGEIDSGPKLLPRLQCLKLCPCQMRN